MTSKTTARILSVGLFLLAMWLMELSIYLTAGVWSKPFSWTSLAQTGVLVTTCVAFVVWLVAEEM